MKPQTVDFLRRPRPPWLGWALLMAACAGLWASLEYRERVATEQRRAQAQMLQQKAHDDRERALALRPVVPTVDGRRLQRAQLVLQQPWLETLRTVESATETPVFLLVLSIDPATGYVQVEGEAPSFADALAYAERLSGHGALASAQLVTHEQMSDALAGGTKLRFALAGQWTQQ